MNILSIGNSFSDDAHRYLHKVSRVHDKTNELYTWNLMIGGCSLSMHHENMLQDNEKYELFVNGQTTRTRTSIKKALFALDWDVITFQQVSHESFKYESYNPYLAELVAYAREVRPSAKIFIQQTWAYLPDSERLSCMGFSTHDDMYAAISETYAKVAKELDVDALIPSGKTMQTLLKLGLKEIHRDQIHANDIARFAIALTWYQMLSGKDISKTDFTHLDFDDCHTKKEIKLAKKASKIAIEKAAYVR